MHNVLIIYLVLAIYFFIGYMLHTCCIKEIYKDNYYSKIYESIPEIFKFLIMFLFMLIWLPVTVGEIICMTVKWIAKYYEE